MSTPSVEAAGESSGQVIPGAGSVWLLLRLCLWRKAGLCCVVSAAFSIPSDFCWMCLGDWKTHGSEYYECSRYKENPDIVNQSQQAQAREALKKYLFYFERVGVLSCTCFSRVGFFHLALLGETPSNRRPQRRMHAGVRAWSAGQPECCLQVWLSAPQAQPAGKDRPALCDAEL